MFRFLVVSMAAIMAVAYAAPTDSCTFNGYTAKNGETFTPPGFSQCVKYNCSKGVTTLGKDGCESDGQCIDVGGTVVKNCVTRRCSKSIQDGVSKYAISIVKALCQDIDGVCRKPGSTFKFKIGATTYDNCFCTVTDNIRVKYGCML